MRDHGEGHFVFRHSLDRQVGNLLLLRRNAAQRCREHRWTIVVIGGNGVLRRRVGLPGESFVRAVPRKLPVAQARVQRDLVAGVFRNRHSVVHSVCRARRDEPHIHDGSRGPGVALVDGIAVRVDLQRAIEVRAFFHRTFAIVLHHAAPEDGLAFVVRALQFEPGVVGIDGAAGEKVSNLLGAYDHIHAHGIAAAQGGLHAVQRSGNRGNFCRLFPE